MTDVLLDYAGYVDLDASKGGINDLVSAVGDIPHIRLRHYIGVNEVVLTEWFK